MRRIDRGRHGDDDEVGFRQLGGIAGDRQLRRRLEVVRRNLAGRVAKSAVSLYFLKRKVISDGGHFLAEFHRQRQAHVAQPDNRNNAHTWIPL